MSRPDGREVTALLVVDLENIRARYECLRCSGREGPVFGTRAVSEFVAAIRADHPQRCTAPQEINR
ncbi:hypothetical protein [Streptomyces sp. SCSIO ZS0520]|uniref:hypothetical protein n=1 Tax=Streptomyces sp. SCSIO ZS0520 TaxID=2892996 RepID=UPI0021D883BB|nr:hypothetical protein [Streptomyces sp. SCSIO ZS0520]